ncbi:unnamed protein product [Effrenium voratum]|uniref:Uncharacterized protein n=1 Tax=Effrenium voratum TaxID=2562239 RepID=A0AA36N5X9_9DINO|nr:unnamed protein product [Effrenium voratum]
MAVIMAVGGDEVMTSEQFAAWFEGQAPSRETGARFVDELRREVARRRRCANFRQLQVLCGSAVLDPGSPWDTTGPWAVLVRPFVEAEGKPKLTRVAQSGDLEQLIKLLEQPVDPAPADKQQKTALYLAALFGHEALVRCLLEVGVATDAPDLNGCRPLHMAAYAGHLGIVRCLLEAGADKDQACAGRSTPLRVAAAKGRKEVVVFLLEAGADKEKADSQGFTPLHVAAEHGQLEVARSLLVAGAEMDKANHFGCTPLYLAAQHGHEELACCLQEAGARA